MRSAANILAGPAASSGHLSLGWLCWNPVYLLADRFLRETAALQNAFTVLDHLRVTAKVGCSLGRIEFKFVEVLAGDILHAAHFAFPGGIFPWAANTRDVTEPSGIMA